MIKAVPAKHFAFPPYTAELINPANGWSGVMNKQGFNCLTFLEDGKPTGKTITDFETAKQIAEAWNERS